jgi:drug/metabolite transporter (DMT)-like permease
MARAEIVAPGGHPAGRAAGSGAAPHLAAALAAVLIWGATPFATKLAVSDLPPLLVGVLRTLLAAPIALALLIRSRGRSPGPGAAWPLVATSGICGFVFFPLLFTFGTALTGAGRGALILGALPVLTGIVAAAVERRAPATRWWLGCGLAMAGVALLVGEHVGFADGGDDLAGGSLVLAAAFCAASGYVAGARAARVVGSWTVTLRGLALGGLLLLPATAFLPLTDVLASASAPSWGALIYLAAGSSLLGYAAWYWALGRGGIARTGLLQFLQPLVGLLLAVALLQERLSWPMILAAGAILGGVAIGRDRR